MSYASNFLHFDTFRVKVCIYVAHVALAITLDSANAKYRNDIINVLIFTYRLIEW